MGRFRLSLLVLWILAGLILPGAALAHGGGTPVLTDAEAGPYRLFVWANPAEPFVGEYHVTVAVTEPVAPGEDPLGGTPVLGAEVTLFFQHLEADEAIQATATHENATNKLLYEGDVALPRPGPWQVTVQVVGPEGEGQASYTIQVAAKRQVNWQLVGGGVLLLLGLAGAGLFVYRRVGG